MNEHELQGLGAFPDRCSKPVSRICRGCSAPATPDEWKRNGNCCALCESKAYRDECGACGKECSGSKPSRTCFAYEVFKATGIIAFELEVKQEVERQAVETAREATRWAAEEAARRKSEAAARLAARDAARQETARRRRQSVPPPRPPLPSTCLPLWVKVLLTTFWLGALFMILRQYGQLEAPNDGRSAVRRGDRLLSILDWAGEVVGTDVDSATGLPKRVVDKKSGILMVLVPAGTFTMGAYPEDVDAEDDEKPQHDVQVTQPFYMAETEVTQSQWFKIMRANPSQAVGSDLPVDSVSWEVAQDYCKATGLRLPTEAEWEYACRAGTKTSRFGELDAAAWHAGNSDSRAHAVRGKEPNAWGLYDMLGNVREWCADDYERAYYSRSPNEDPPGPMCSSLLRVLRGGAWSQPGQFHRSSYRQAAHSFLESSLIGFRPVRTCLPLTVAQDSPVVSFNSPPEGAHVASGKMRVSGTVSPSLGPCIVTVAVGDAAVTIPADRWWATDVQILAGRQTITVSAKWSTGKKTPIAHREVTAH